MIIRSNGVVVGLIDNKTLELTESESDELTGLIKDFRSNGISTFRAQEDQAPEQTSGEVEGLIEFDSTYFIDAVEMRLLIAGFDVQA